LHASREWDSHSSPPLQGKAVEGNQEGSVNIKKLRTWRQYMNRCGILLSLLIQMLMNNGFRRGGFNRYDGLTHAIPGTFSHTSFSTGPLTRSNDRSLQMSTSLFPTRSAACSYLSRQLSRICYFMLSSQRCLSQISIVTSVYVASRHACRVAHACFEEGPNDHY
jgi:hypothetical protein